VRPQPNVLQSVERQLFDEALWPLGLREIGERVGLHFSAVGNAVQRVADKPTRTMAQALRELEQRFKNQETPM
jgi:hypothetical protein